MIEPLTLTKLREAIVIAAIGLYQAANAPAPEGDVLGAMWRTEAEYQRLLDATEELLRARGSWPRPGVANAE